jgi:hydroxymethylbilane synthase
MPVTVKSVWAAGTKTMKELAAKGYWVNGTSDSLGDDELRKLRAGRAISLMVDTNAPLTVLSNDLATSTLGEVKACYTRSIAQSTSKEFDEKINTTDVFYWTSFFQYQAYVAKYPQILNRVHVCGLGKTYDHFKERNINVLPMSSMEEFKTWIKQ